ncbi:SpoIIE family protein phosphatase [Streptomyces mayteni]
MKWSRSERWTDRFSAGRRALSALAPRSIAAQVFALVTAIMLFFVIAGAVTLVAQARRSSEDQARGRALAVSEALAHTPEVRRALESDDPSTPLQPLAQSVRRHADVDYVVITAPNGVRFTHPNPREIGKKVEQSLSPATEGRAFTDKVPGQTISAASIRAAVPVEDSTGRVIGIVNTGVTIPNATHDIDRGMPLILGITGAALLLSAGAVALVTRRLRRQTHGLGTAELTRMYEHQDAVLHSVREGILITDDDGRLLLVNDEARRLLGLAEDTQGRHVTEVGLGPEVGELLATQRVANDEVVEVSDRLLAVNQRPAERRGRPMGAVATLRDTTELRALADRADVARQRLKLLYDASVAVGTSLDMRRTAQELAQVAVPRFADVVTVDLLESVLAGDEPRDTDRRTRRVARAGGREDTPLARVGERVELEAAVRGGDGADGRAIVSHAPYPEHGVHSLLTVPLRVGRVVLGQVGFWRTDDTPPFDDDDQSLAHDLASHLAACVENGRRFTGEHARALDLQQSLLPRDLPEQTAVDAAFRYLPAVTGVGGDWYDVIPLSSARVALVVGDVVGHGLRAAATMGRLRTAVQNFSALDLPPDDLLAHLDELVVRLDRDAAASNGGDGIIGATCLYAIYDPVSRHCLLARAGHPLPALVRPDGSVEFPQLPAGPPLGLGGLPFEAADLELPEGSSLVLYTDGLVEDRDRDITAGLDRLGAALAHPGRTPEETCQAVTDALLPERPKDDIALLVARTNALDARHVVSWDLTVDPSVCAGMRAAVTEQLAQWHLEELAFTTELVVSELLGNAIRHAAGPIQLRLLRNRALICEVADGSTIAPHLRSAAGSDEGGRGLFLVAQLVTSWGTRYTSTGKVIWTEQTLPPTAGGG